MGRTINSRGVSSYTTKKEVNVVISLVRDSVREELSIVIDA